MSRKHIEEAIRIFLNIKARLDEANIDEKSKTEVKSKLRSRAREIPEMIVELGFIPTLSFCLAKSGIDNLRMVIDWIEYGKAERFSEYKPEELSYALYVYVILKYLSNHMSTLKLDQGEVNLDLEMLGKGKRTTDVLYRYLEALAYGVNALVASKLLQPYLLQFKRLCEAEFPSERGR